MRGEEANTSCYKGQRELEAGNKQEERSKNESDQRKKENESGRREGIKTKRNSNPPLTPKQPAKES